MNADYVHGYSPTEHARLVDQANTLTELLHSDTRYPAGSLVLEAGCGVGAQTVTLAANSPEARFISVDISEKSLARAQARVAEAGSKNVTFQRADIFALPFAPETFDHIFVCFVLEHLSDAEKALRCLRTLLRPGGTITAIEGDHGSTFFHPDDENARRAIQCLVDLQSQGGGDALIGRRLQPLLASSGFSQVRVSPRMVYADATRPELVTGFTKNTFTAMVAGVRDRALTSGMIDRESWDKGIAALYQTAENGGVFCYTFFKATAVK